ncbi:unnamed protein product (macronuclear) [Paramecium tetraurelia]|uniref:Translocation protein SEC62 n=1 Tax=Paramecium tetraurelia TaxID=5888 RepID=A0CVI9_PARTE|nr:uncharacterized protein GSPATT00010974001 [Paramecium tetraurelia]CAK74806.1 unnamed protein product [Paramecium tetraurelia]|eukprot:XP_001442203.1 hypothetical protein (macronuclear) [Paramecium tetraurelia strain d4-2]
MNQQRKEFEKYFYPLYQHYHQQHSGFKLREANFSYQRKIQYFKGEDFIKFTTANFEEIKGLVPLTDKKKDAAQIAKYLLECKIIWRIDRHTNDPKKKWPKLVTLVRDQTFVEDGFYTWSIDVKNKMNSIKLAAILLGVFLICLFPIWPFSFKYGIFKFTIYLLISLIGLQVGRLLLYSIIRLFGYEFWILPNINDDSYGILGSFLPIYSISKYSDGKLEIALRLVGLVAFFMLIFVIVQEPHHLTHITDATGQTLDDVFQWGKEKMEGKQEPLHRRAIPDLSELIKQAEEDSNNAQNVLQDEKLEKPEVQNDL